MKCINIRAGKYVIVSDELAAKVARAAAAFELSREDAEQIIAAEPRHAAVFCGPM